MPIDQLQFRLPGNQGVRPRAPQNQSAGNPGGNPVDTFEYRGLTLQDHSPAIGWVAGRNGIESGAHANEGINQDYSNLSRAAYGYMQAGSGAPVLNNFFEFAEQASNEVGQQINNIENLQRAATGDVSAAAQAGLQMSNGQQVDQVRRVGASTLNQAAFRVLSRNPAGNPVGQATQISGQTAGQMWHELDVTRDALVRGNVNIHRHLGPAADAFFKGEADGGQGVEALRKAGYYPGSQADPDGLITRGFTSMRRARELSQEWQTASPERRAEIERQREAAAKDSTFSFMMHEQGHILQTPQIFDNPVLRRNLGAITPTMTFTDANGTHRQLGQGQNYANFEERVGLRQVAADTPGAFPLTKNGRTTYYTPDPSQRGSIVDYFSNNISGPRAQHMIETGPRPLNETPTTQTGRGILQTAEGIDNGDVSTVVAGAIRTVGGVGSQGLQEGGNSVRQSGNAVIMDGIRRMQGSGVISDTTGAAEVVVGVGLHQAGQTLRTAGTVARVGVDQAANLADRTINNLGTTARVTRNLLRWALR